MNAGQIAMAPYYELKKAVKAIPPEELTITNERIRAVLESIGIKYHNVSEVKPAGNRGRKPFFRNDLEEYVKANPGQTTTQIATALNKKVPNVFNTLTSMSDKVYKVNKLWYPMVAAPQDSPTAPEFPLGNATEAPETLAIAA